jgi:UDP-glucose 4-epimerase
VMQCGDAVYGEVFNVGSAAEVAIAGLAERVRAATGSASDIVRVPYDEAYEAGFEDMRRRVPDTSKIHSLIGWEPTRSLDDIIGDVIEYQQQASVV